MALTDRDKFIDEMADLDDIVDHLADGQYVVPISPLAPQYNYRDIHRYCQAKGIDPSQLTDEELKTFEV